MKDGESRTATVLHLSSSISILYPLLQALHIPLSMKPLVGDISARRGNAVLRYECDDYLYCQRAVPLRFN
jgi:hypothetical protein